MKAQSDKKIIIINIALLFIFIALLIYATFRFTPYITSLIREPGNFRNLLLSYGVLSVPIFILFQVLQVVIAAVPGELVQIGGGYVYGTVGGTIYSVVGILLGSMLAFYLTRLLGHNLVKFFVSKKNQDRFDFLINSPKSEIAMFILFLIPGIPKDILVYIAGLTPIKPLKFFLIYTIARSPAIFFSAYIGANLETRNYFPVIIISIIACVLFAVGVIKKNQLINKLDILISKKRLTNK